MMTVYFNYVFQILINLLYGMAYQYGIVLLIESNLKSLKSIHQNCSTSYLLAIFKIFFNVNFNTFKAK